MDTEFVAGRLQCSRTDKQDCLLIIQQLLDLAFFAREHGFVELDTYLRGEPLRFSDPFLKKAISCLADIGDYALAEKVLTNYILAGNYSGPQFLKSMVIMETVLALHRHVDLDRIFSFLVPSLFGLDSEEEILAMYRRQVELHGFRNKSDSAAAKPAQGGPGSLRPDRPEGTSLTPAPNIVIPLT